MKIKKICILLIFAFVLTGCTAEYNLKIEEQYIDEELIINNYNSNTWNSIIGNLTYKKLIDNNYSIPLPILSSTPGIFENTYKLEGYNYYNQTIISNEDNYGLKLNARFAFDEYNDSTIVKNIYNNFKVSKNNNVISIIASDNLDIFLMYNLTKTITINVDVPFKVIYNNADKINENTYTWIINKDNVSSKSIVLKYSTNDNEDKIISEDNSQTNYKLITIIASVLVLTILTILTVFKTKFKKNNDI